MNIQGELFAQEPGPHTLGHIDCASCHKLRAMYLCSLSADLPFEQAASLYMQVRSMDAVPGAVSRRYVKDNTAKSYRSYLRFLTRFFTGTQLSTIHFGHFKAYQHARLRGDPPFVGPRRCFSKTIEPQPALPKKVNQELGLLKMIMKRANAWTPELEEYCEDLQVEECDLPRALSPEEQYRFLDIARMEPRWMIVYHYAIIALHTCMGTNELRYLRIGDINLLHRLLTVAKLGAKNRYRRREIPLVSADVLWSLEQLLLRAREIGSTEAHHYLFPFFDKKHGGYDPTRPMSETGLRRMWCEVREAAKLPKFRQYDLRHTAITRLAEAGTPVDVILSMAGHVDERMRKHYTHISQQSKIQALEAAQRIRFRPQPAQKWSGFDRRRPFIAS